MFAPAVLQPSYTQSGKTFELLMIGLNTTYMLEAQENVMTSDLKLISVCCYSPAVSMRKILCSG
jgi:hypothetical protein